MTLSWLKPATSQSQVKHSTTDPLPCLKNFIDDLKSTPWDIIKVFDDANDIVDTWSDLFCDIVDKLLPLRQHRVKRKQQPKWLTADIIDAFTTRDRFKSLNNHEQCKIWIN